MLGLGLGLGFLRRRRAAVMQSILDFRFRAGSYSPGEPTFSRPSAADWFNVAGNGLEAQVGNDILRRGPVRGALLEPSVTAVARNSLLLSSGGTWPPADDTLAVGLAASSGGSLTREIRYGLTNGFRVMRIRYFGIPSSTGGNTISFAPSGFDANVIGETFFHQVWTRLAAGSWTNISPLLLRHGSEPSGSTSTPNATGEMRSTTRATTAAVSALVLRWNYLDTIAPVDFTLEVGLPMSLRIDGTPLAQLTSEQIISPILTDATANVTRAADVLTRPLALPLDHTIIAVARTPTFLPVAGAFQEILRVRNASTPGPRITRDSSGAILAGGTGGASATLAAPAAGSRFAVAYTNAAATVRASLNGGPVVAASARASVAGFDTLQIGAENAAGTSAWGGFIERVVILPRVADDSELQSLATLATWGG